MSANKFNVLSQDDDADSEVYQDERHGSKGMSLASTGTDHDLGAYDTLVRKTMRQNIIRRMEQGQRCSTCSEVWEDKEEVPGSTGTGSPSSEAESWKSLKDVPDWRPSLVTRWKKSILSVWRHSLTESVCSESLDKIEGRKVPKDPVKTMDRISDASGPSAKLSSKASSGKGSGKDPGKTKSSKKDVADAALKTASSESDKPERESSKNDSGNSSSNTDSKEDSKADSSLSDLTWRKQEAAPRSKVGKEKYLPPSRAEVKARSFAEPAEDGEDIVMTRAQKRTKNRALRRNRHRERLNEEMAEEAGEEDQSQRKESFPQRKSALIASTFGPVPPVRTSRKSVRFEDDEF